MTKVIVVLHKRPDMDSNELRRYWKDTHGPIAAKLPGLRRYVQNHVLPDPSQSALPCDGIAELWFDSPEAMQAGFASPEAQAVWADVPNFCDTKKTGFFVAEEIRIVG